MSILEDYDHDVEDNFAEIVEAEKEVTQLVTTYDFIRTNGVELSTVAALQSGGMLSSMTFSAIALEYLSDQKVNAGIALEGLAETLKTKVTAWSAKILKFVTSTAGKIKEKIAGLLDKLKTDSTKAKEALSKQSGLVKTKIKAHPYKSIAAGLLAVAAVIGILIFSAQAIPGLKSIPACQALNTKLVSMIKQIKWPFGAITAVVKENGKKIALGIAAFGLATVATIGTLGWTSSSVDSSRKLADASGSKFNTVWEVLKSHTKRAATNTGTIIKGLYQGTVTGAKMAAYDQADGSTASKVVRGIFGGAVGFIAVAITSIVYVLYRLIEAIIVGTFKALAMTFRAIMYADKQEEDYI